MPTERRRPAARPFTLADALILIAAATVGLALVRGWRYPVWFSLFVRPFFGNQEPSPGRRVFNAVSLGVSWTIPFGITCTVALLIARGRSPRPAWRRIARQPGAVGCAAALMAMAFCMGREVVCWVLGYLTRPQSLVRLPSPPFVRYDNPGFHPPWDRWIRTVVLEMFPLQTSPAVGLAVASAWGVLKATGRWRPEPGWIDRSGRWLSLYWMALGVTLAALAELWKFLL